LKVSIQIIFALFLLFRFLGKIAFITIFLIIISIFVNYFFAKRKFPLIS